MENNPHEIQFMVDPFSGRVALFIPAPIVVFEGVDEYTDFIDLLKDALTKFTVEIQKTEEPDPIKKDYAKEVIDSWQTQLLRKLPMDDGPKK